VADYYGLFCFEDETEEQKRVRLAGGAELVNISLLRRPDSKIPEKSLSKMCEDFSLGSDDKAIEDKGIKVGTVLICAPPSAEYGGKADVFESATSVKIIGSVPKGEKVETAGPSEDVDGYVMIPIKKPKGAICLRAFQVEEVGAEGKPLTPRSPRGAAKPASSKPAAKPAPGIKKKR